MRRQLFFITIDEACTIHKTTAWGFDQGEAMDAALRSLNLEYHTINFMVATPVAEGC